MAGTTGPDETGPTRPDDAGDGDFERRRRDLDARLAERRAAMPVEPTGPRANGLSGMGKALRLSSEFIAGIVVGVAIGWFFDQMLGTSPWGLIVFLLLGFVAGVVNVLRSVGVLAEHEERLRDDETR